MEILSEDQIERVLEWYEKDPGEALVGDEILEGVGVDDLRRILRADTTEDPQLFDTYEVEPHEVEGLQPLVSHPIDLEAYDYFVAAYRKGRA